MVYLPVWCLVPPGGHPGRTGIAHWRRWCTGCPAAGSSGGRPCCLPSLIRPSWGRQQTVCRPSGTGAHSPVPAPRRPSWRTRSRRKPSGLEGIPWLRSREGKLENEASHQTRICVNFSKFLLSCVLRDMTSSLYAVFPVQRKIISGFKENKNENIN